MAFSIYTLSACKPAEIKQYRVAKVAAPQTQKTVQAVTDFKFTLPESWKTEAASGMRAASFSTPGQGDVSVVNLPGKAGDLKGNLNRWRGQVDLAPLESQQEVEAAAKSLKIDGTDAVLFELHAPAGKPDKAMRVALLEKSGKTWFFKLAGTREVVKAQGAAFDEFAKSIQLAATNPFAATEPAGTPNTPDAPNTANIPGHPPMAGAPPGMDSNSAGNMPPMGNNAAVVQPPSDTTMTYTVPSNWQEKPASSMRTASFEVKSGKETADVSVVSLAGDGGGLLSNTNRWRQQLEMAPTDQAGLKNTVKDIKVDGYKGYFMALYTALEGNGMLVALIEQDDHTWFIKMMGTSKLIQTQEKDFEAFVESIRFQMGKEAKRGQS